jgi:hypothetical protein
MGGRRVGSRSSRLAALAAVAVCGAVLVDTFFVHTHVGQRLDAVAFARRDRGNHAPHRSGPAADPLTPEHRAPTVMTAQRHGDGAVSSVAAERLLEPP